ncbi:MAG: isopeptide-forming domain-containing fimbrial protein, partial [Turicibacter sp.]|nr:isopeptide-forming domain-containing fimbrial protein [Turicibacter sp.]
MANITVNSVDDLQNAINNSPDNPSTPYVIDLGSNFTDPYAGGHINIPQTKNILIESAPGSTITMNPNSANRPNLNVDGRLILQNVNVNNVNIVLNGTGGTYGDGGTPTGDGTSPTHLANDPVLTLATGAHLQGTSILVPQGVVIMDPGSTMDGVGSDNLIPSANNGVVLYGNLGNATLNMDGGQMSRFNTAIVVNGDSPSSNAVNGSRSVNIFGNCAGQSGYDYPLFNNNNRNQQGSGGSVIQAWSGTVNVSCAQFINNTASGQGYNGGAIFIGGDAHFGANQSYFQGNTAPTGNGGAIYLDSAEKSIINFSNFQSNSAQLGGAAYVATGKSDVIGSTFASNTATTTDSLGGSAGALYNQPAYAAGYPYPPNSTAYGNLIVAADNVFSGNNSPQTFTGAASLSGTPNIQVPTSISGGQQVLNNLDINYYNTLAPNLVTSKAASTPSTVPGGTFAYTLRVMNNGTAPTTNFLVSDPLPNGLTLMGGSVSGSLNGVGATVTTGGTAATPTFTFDSPLQPGDSATITFMVQVPADAPNGTVIANTANFTLDGTTNVPATSGNTIVGTPTLSASKVSSTDSVNPGDTFSYTITIANQGDAPTTNFFITDPLPNGLTMVPGSVDASINGVLSPVTATGTATAPVFTFPTQLNPGDSATVTFNVQVPQNAANTTFTNTAVATPDGITNIPATSGPVQMGTPLLNVVKGNTSTGNVAPGDSFLYTVSVTNDCTGNFPTTNPYFLNEFLPPGVTITGPVTDDKGDVITTNGTTGNVIFTVNGTVQPGETTLFKIPVTVDASARPGSLNNTVTAIPGNGGSPTHATDNTVNVASSPPALAVVKTHSAPDPLTPGDWFTYSLTIVNTGQSPTTNPYTVTDTLPGNLVYAGGATSSGGGIITNDATTGVITFHVSDAIPAGGTELLTIPVRVDPNAPVGPLAANSATVTPGNDGNPITATENNPPTVTATAPDLSALKTHSAPDPLYPGNSFIYTVTVANNGQTATTNPYTLTESLPPYLTYNGGATSTGGGTVLGNQNSGAITFNVGDSIPPGGTELIQIPVTVDPDAPAGPLQINSITVDPGNGGDPVTATCLPPTITALPPILDVDKTHTAPDPLHPGDSFTYALTIINSGQQPTTNPYTVTEQLPDGLTYAGGAISTGGGAISNDGDFGTITFTVNDSIPSGGVDLITIPVTLSPDASAGALDINSATVTPGNGGNPSTGTDNVPLIISPPVAVIAPPLMNVSKTANVASIKPGESFNYALTLTNSGGGPTDNPYTVTDSLPAYLSLTGIPTASSGASVTPDGTTGTITLTVNGSIPNQGTEVITLPVTVSDDAPLGMLANNTATVTPGNGGDPATGTDNTPPTMVPLPTPSLDVAKSHNLSSVQPGQTFNYLLTVTNNGTAPTANPYTVSDTLPDYLTYAGGATTSSGGAVTGTATGLSLDLNVEDSIPPGESRIISIPVTVSEDAPYSSGGSTVNLGQNTVTVDPGNGGNPSTAVEANPPTVMAPNAPIVYVLKNHTAQT